MLPEDFLERTRRMLGGEYEAFLRSFAEERYQALRLNPLKKGADGRSAAERYGIAEAGEKPSFAHLTKVPWAQDGYYYPASDQPGRHPCHEAGLYYIQEPSAMAPAELLDVQPGDRALDLCAAPGGKSTQIAAMLKGSGLLFCNEIHPARAKILSENVERMGIGNACVTNETPERLADHFEGYFDKILVDAPCSGEGMFRKNAEACAEWSRENVALCAERQDGILDCAARMLRPGGRLVYSTCTFAPEEDEGSVGRFLQRHGDFTIFPIKKDEMGFVGCDGMPEYIENPVPGLEHTLRLWPHRIKGEGHYAAVLQKGCSFMDGGDVCLADRQAYGYGSMACLADRQTGGYGSTACPADRQAGRSGCFADKSSMAGKKAAGRGSRAKGDITRRTGDRGAAEAADSAAEGLASLLAGVDADAESIRQRLAETAGMEKGAEYLWFGDQLYLTVPEMPSLKGLRVLRPGLHLGELKKNRFEPSHALALALPPSCAAHVWNLDSGDPVVRAYLNGRTFPAEGVKGWYLICVDGFSIGWGKLADGIMKNHYPKGLRRNVF